MKPIILNYNDSNSDFLYIQIYEAVKVQILSGDMVSGEKLPSLRRLAKELAVSITTVDLAYSQLLVEGYINSRPHSGFYISNVFPAEASPASETEDAEKREDGEIYPPSPYIYDPQVFDFVKWKKCAARVFNQCSELLMFEGDTQGELPLRREISRYIYRFRGVNASPEQIVIGAGTQQITGHLSRILSRIGISLVSLEAPGYLPVQSMFTDGGFTVLHIPVSQEGISIEQLPSNISSAVYVSPSNQFPTGAVMPIGRRHQLLKWAKDNNSIIIEDDYDSELRYFGKPVPAMQGLDKDNRVVYLGSFSSTLFPAVKISYMVLPPDLAEIFKSIKSQYTQTCSKAEQLTLAFFMEEGHYYTGIRRLRSLYARKLETVLASIHHHGRGKIVALDTKSGITLNLLVQSNQKAEELCLKAKSLGLQLVPVSRISDQNTSALSFYYSQLPLDRIDPLIESLVESWKL